MFCKKIWSKNSFVGKKCFLVWPYQNSVKDYQNQFLDKILLQISLLKFGSEVRSKKMGLPRFCWDVWSKNAFAKKGIFWFDFTNFPFKITKINLEQVLISNKSTKVWLRGWKILFISGKFILEQNSYCYLFEKSKNGFAFF